jgi:hypothetical protein
MIFTTVGLCLVTNREISAMGLFLRLKSRGIRLKQSVCHKSIYTEPMRKPMRMHLLSTEI